MRKSRPLAPETAAGTGAHPHSHASVRSQPNNAACKIILAIDIGSSSTRCSAWKWNVDDDAKADGGGGAKLSAGSDGRVFRSSLTYLPAQGGGVVVPYLPSSNGEAGAHKGAEVMQDSDRSPAGGAIIMSVRTLRAIHPATGRILSVSRLLDAVDQVVDETLEKIRNYSHRSYKLQGGNGEENHVQDEAASVEIVGVGITAFAMNLVGVDRDGQPLEDDKATLTYACNLPEVAEQVSDVKEYVNVKGRCCESALPVVGGRSWPEIFVGWARSLLFSSRAFFFVSTGSCAVGARASSRICTEPRERRSTPRTRYRSSEPSTQTIPTFASGYTGGKRSRPCAWRAGCV
jgi:hypothetical protein